MISLTFSSMDTVTVLEVSLLGVRPGIEADQILLVAQYTSTEAVKRDSFLQRSVSACCGTVVIIAHTPSHRTVCETRCRVSIARTACGSADTASAVGLQEGTQLEGECWSSRPNATWARCCCWNMAFGSSYWLPDVASAMQYVGL